MSEKPILFSGEMVRAILEGRKTQTRRVIKPQPFFNEFAIGTYHPTIIDKQGEYAPGEAVFGIWELHDGGWAIKCPYGQIGDQLWVRETFAAAIENNYLKPSDLEGLYIYYKANTGNDWERQSTGEVLGQWRPSIHMPRWASRIQIEIKNMSVERVQDVSEEDAVKEGVLSAQGIQDYKTKPLSFAAGRTTPKDAFSELWDSINEKRGFSWDSNPWVWVLEFEVIS